MAMRAKAKNISQAETQASKEERLLTQLSTSKTNLIDDEDLVVTLAENQRMSDEIKERQVCN